MAMTRSEQLAYITDTFSPDEALTVAVHLRAAGQGKAAGIWFEAADHFERTEDAWQRQAYSEDMLPL